MNFFLLLGAFLLAANTSVGQRAQSYNDAKGNTHLCGPFSIKKLQKDSVYSKWFYKNYNQFDIPKGEYAWKEQLKNMTVDIYLGTWCDDSKKWVPRFVKLWEQLGLNKNQLKFTALYDFNVEGKYKQGPNGEEKGKKIYRIPTFIFQRKGKEVARIVESPVDDLKTDIAQIALGSPTQPKYRAATYMMNLLEEKTKENIEKNKQLYLAKIRHQVEKSSELNILGYVYLSASKIDKALIVFAFNTYLFEHTPNVYDSYAEALAVAGKTQQAIAYYKKVLTLDNENKHAIKQLKKLKAQQDAAVKK